MPTLESQLQRIAGNVKPGLLVEQGLVIVPFDMLNSTPQDLIRAYVQPYTVNSLAKKLLAIRVPVPGDRVSTLNVFTSRAYIPFLQMISKEDFVENRDRHKTDSIRLLLSEVTNIDPNKLPLLQNTSTGRKIFERIDRSPYNVFARDCVHYVEVMSTYLERGVRTRLCEFNIYLPDKYFMGGI